MTKKEFCALPVPPAPELGIPACREYHGQYISGQEYIARYPNRTYAARMVGGCLEITAYNAGDGAPLWRTWQDSDRVFGQTLGEHPTLSMATAGSRMGWSGGDWYGAPETEVLIRQWTRSQYWEAPRDMAGIRLAAWSQTKLRHKKRDEKWDRIRREIDNAMVEIREPVKDFARWLTREAFRDSHYLVYPYRKRTEKVTGVCTRCGGEVTFPAKAVRNHGQIRCPRCHTAVTCISEKSLARTRGYRHRRTAAYLQPTSEGFCLRVFHAWLETDAANYRSPKLDWLEKERYFYSLDLGQVTKAFAYKEFETSKEVRWCNWCNSPYGNAWLYPGNLKGLFAGTDWQHIPMAELARRGGALEIGGMIRAKGSLGIEHLAKHGLWRLAADRLRHPPEGFGSARDIRAAMDGLPMDEIRLLMAVDPDEAELALYMAVRNLTRLTPEQLRQMILLGFAGNRWLIQDLLRHTTWHRINRYLGEQLTARPKDDNRRKGPDMPAAAQDVAADWRDYLRDAEALGWDLSSDFILFPRDLPGAHRQTIQLLADRKNPEINKRIQSVLREQAIFAWETGKYLIRPPVSAGEIVMEGKILHHCVGGYTKDVARGESIILFVREKEDADTPLVTVELDPGSWTVRQARGRYNRDPGEGVKRFLRQWRQQLERRKESRERERSRTA